MKNQSITSVLTPAPVTVAPSDSVAAAQRVMHKHRCHHVPVVDDGRVVGMIGARDLLKALLVEPEDDIALKQSALGRTRVADVMRSDVVVLSDAATVLDAAKMLRQGRIHALPVLASNRELVGIVTSTDLIAALADALEHPTVDQARPSANGEEIFDQHARLLRRVFQATVEYLESGCAEIEHSRLLKAVNEARERISKVDLSI